MSIAMTTHGSFDPAPLRSTPTHSISRPSPPHVKYPPEPPRSAFSGVYMPTLAIDGSVGVRSMRERKGTQTVSPPGLHPATQRALQLSGVMSKTSSRSDGEKKQLERRRSVRGVVDLLARTLTGND